MIVYKIWCKANNRYYIGQTLNFKQRVCYHKTYLRRRSHSNKILQRAFNKYGEENFEFSIIERCNDLDHLNEREIFWIKYFEGVTKGFNIQLGGHSDRPSLRGLRKLKKKAQKQNKSVRQYTLSGELVTEFISLKQAAEKIGCSSSEILRACKGELEQARNFQWRYTKDGINQLSKVLSFKEKSSNHLKNYNKITKSKSIIQKDKEGNFLKRYTSISEAVKLNNFKNASMITNCLTQRPYCKTAYGYVWEYENN